MPNMSGVSRLIGRVSHATFMRLLTVDVRHHVQLPSSKQHACYFQWIMHELLFFYFIFESLQSNKCLYFFLFKKEKHLFFGLAFLLQAVRTREGGAAQYGRRRLSDVARDDGQSQSGAGGRSGAGGGEPIGRPGVTRRHLLVPHAPST